MCKIISQPMSTDILLSLSLFRRNTISIQHCVGALCIEKIENKSIKKTTPSRLYVSNE